MKKNIFIVAAVLISSQLQAQQDSTKSMDEVVVTANKYPQKQSSTGKVLTVINREQLEKNTGRTLTQVLNEQAGIVVNGAQNTLGTNQTIYMRGADRSATLILVDGVPATDASGISIEFDLNHFSIDQVERVEILKGSQSVLYGSDAMAGVINIITRKAGAKKPLALNATAAAGTYGTLKGNAGISGTTHAFTYNLQYSHLQSDGFSSAQEVNGNAAFDKDGFNQDAVSLNLGAAITKNWKLRLFGQADRYKADIDDDAFTDDRNKINRNKNLQVGIASVYQLSKGSFYVNLHLNNTNRRLEDKRNVPEDPNDYDPYNGQYKGHSLFTEAYVNLDLHQHIGLLLGTDMRKQSANIETTYGNLGDDSLRSTQLSGYASLLIKSLSGFNAEIGSRYTHHSEFGSAVTWSINPSYYLHRQVKIFANIATGFKSPSLYNLASEYGNKALKPERSNSYEAGLQLFDKNNKANIRFTYFNRTVKDVIIFKSLFVAPYGQYDNADKQKDHGLELEAILHPTGKWNITASYSFVDGKIETISKATGKDTSFYNLYRRPKHTFNAGISYQVSKALYAAVGFRWVDQRQDPWFNPNTFETEIKELKAYYNADVYISYQAAKQVKLFADFRNITDRTYFDLYGYNSRRFNMMAGATVNF